MESETDPDTINFDTDDEIVNEPIFEIEKDQPTMVSKSNALSLGIIHEIRSSLMHAIVLFFGILGCLYLHEYSDIYYHRLILIYLFIGSLIHMDIMSLYTKTKGNYFTTYIVRLLTLYLLHTLNSSLIVLVAPNGVTIVSEFGKKWVDIEFEVRLTEKCEKYAGCVAYAAFLTGWEFCLLLRAILCLIELSVSLNFKFSKTSYNPISNKIN